MMVEGLEATSIPLLKRLKVVQDIQKGKFNYTEISEVFDNLMSDFKIAMI